MYASKLFIKYFTYRNLEFLYNTDIKLKNSPGIDRVGNNTFEKNLKENLKFIKKNVINGTFRFSKYREKLLVRGRTKLPRVISIPTIKDKLVLKTLLIILNDVFPEVSPFLHRMIEIVKSELLNANYDSVIRLDVVDFYPSIDHDILMKKIQSRVRKKEILELITSAIKQTTVSFTDKKQSSEISSGLPQGIPISNLLANIYLYELDREYSEQEGFRYFRYVDDIVVLCREADTDEIVTNLKLSFLKLQLKLYESNTGKFEVGKISDGFTYLGYKFEGSVIRVRESSMDRLRNSILRHFTKRKYSDTYDNNIFQWNLNLLITGCIFQNTRYGWLFYFSQINDLESLHKLDHFVAKLVKRFNIDTKAVKIKKFVKTYFEINRNIRNTKYIPNFDKLKYSEKRIILSDIFGLDEQELTTQNIDFYFTNYIFKSIKFLEKDLLHHS